MDPSCTPIASQPCLTGINVLLLAKRKAPLCSRVSPRVVDSPPAGAVMRSTRRVAGVAGVNSLSMMSLVSRLRFDEPRMKTTMTIQRKTPSTWTTSRLSNDDYKPFYVTSLEHTSIRGGVQIFLLIISPIVAYVSESPTVDLFSNCLAERD